MIYRVHFLKGMRRPGDGQPFAQGDRAVDCAFESSLRFTDELPSTCPGARHCLGFRLHCHGRAHERRRAGDGVGRTRRTVVVSRARPTCTPAASSTLGVFRPTPYVIVGGANPVGPGYSPLDIYGDQTLALYGPLSPFRTATAPLVIYERGYDGRIHKVEAASFSNPNLRALSPVIYPTQANYYYAPRVMRTPPWWPSAINWIDQN